MPRTPRGWLTVLLGCLLLSTGCAIDPEHFDGFNPAPGAVRKDVAYSEMRALHSLPATRDVVSPPATDPFGWQPCMPQSEAEATGLQCGLLTVPADPAAGADPTPTVVLSVVRRPAVDAAARQGVLLVATGSAVPARELLTGLGTDPQAQQLNRTFDLIGLDPRATDPPTDATIPATDLESVRSALGESAWSLLGVGSGAAAVARYVAAHPDRTRVAVLDRPADTGTAGGTVTRPAFPQMRLATRTCGLGPAGVAVGGSDLELAAAAPSNCPAAPVLLVTDTALVDGLSTGDGRWLTDGLTGTVLTVADERNGGGDGIGDGAANGLTGPGGSPCAGAAITAFVLTLSLPAGARSCS